MNIDLKKIIDVDEKNIKLASRQGEIDGLAETPSSNSTDISEWEKRQLGDISNGWNRYKNSCDLLKADISDRLNDISTKSERDFAKSEESLGLKQKKALDFLDVEIGESSKSYQTLKAISESAEMNYSKVANQLGRPVQTSMVGGYILFMALLALAEIPVNRLAFELYFESMRAVSLLLSAAVGALLIYFAHTIGKQLKHSRCELTSTNSSQTYLAVLGISALCLLVMVYLGVMREQVVALQSAGGLNLEDINLEDLTSGESGNQSWSLTMGPAAFFLVVLNFAIFLTGVVAAFFRHDSHPYFEKLENLKSKADKEYNAAVTHFEQRQLEILKEFASKMSTSSDEFEARSSYVEDLQAQRLLINAEIKRSKQKVTSYTIRMIQSYRKENILNRKTAPPECFTIQAEDLVARNIV